MIRISAIAASLVFAGLVFSTPVTPLMSRADAAELPQGLHTVTLKVKKMDCVSCVYILPVLQALTFAPSGGWYLSQSRLRKR